MAHFGEIKLLRKQVDSSILRMPGIMGVATGYKQAGGKRTDELAVIVYVAKKLSLERLPFFHTIPSSLSIRGVEVPTDIVEVGYYIPYAYDTRQRPALGGDSIGHLNVTAGTLGGLVCGPACETQEDSTLILSNNHVLADVNQGQKGDHIVQPGPYDGGNCHDDCIATLERFVPMDLSDGAVNYVDCAVALPYDTSDVSFEIRDIGIPNLSEEYALSQQDVVNATHVQKTGRTTQHTEGYVSAVDWKGTVLYDWTPVYFENQIVVESLDGNPVALGGDSGSLVLTMDAKICGLLFAGPADGTHFIANHIGEVFTRLNVGLCCAPTEAVKGTRAESDLPGIRRLRDQLRTDKRLRKQFELYGKHSGKVLEAMLREPELGKKARRVTEAVGQIIKNPRETMNDKAIERALELIDTISEAREEDKEFLKDMRVARDIVTGSKGKTLAEILSRLRR